MFHYDGKYDTYARFFLAICEATGYEALCAEMTAMSRWLNTVHAWPWVAARAWVNLGSIPGLAE